MWPREALGDGELGLACPHALQLGLDMREQEHGRDVLEQGAPGRLLVAGELLGSIFLRARAHGMVYHAAGPRILERGRRLDIGEAEVLHEPRASVRGCHLGAEGAEALREPHRLAGGG